MNPSEYHNLRQFLVGLAEGKFDATLTPLLAAMALETLDQSQERQAETPAAQDVEQQQADIRYLRSKLTGDGHILG